jgi:hypothetical protein
MFKQMSVGLATIVGIAAVSCTAIACAPTQRPDVARDKIGDTLVVQYAATAKFVGATTSPTTLGNPTSDDAAIGDALAVAESTTGRVYVFDRTVPALVIYDTSGAFISQWGRVGKGPGEYSEGIAGIAVAPNGDVLLHDVSAQRLVRYDTSGQAKAHIAAPFGLFTDRSTSIDNDGRIRIKALIGTSAAVRQWPWPIGQVIMANSGQTTDSIPPPKLPDSPVGSPKPFEPSKLWDMAGDYAIVARSDDYVIHVLHPAGRVVRIVRNVTSPDILPEEVTWVRQRVPNFVVPAKKPILTNLMIGTDSTIWIERSAEALKTAIPRLTEYERIPEPLILDVYSVEGDALGSVEFSFAARLLAASRRAIIIQRERDDGSTIVERHALVWKHR